MDFFFRRHLIFFLERAFSGKTLYKLI